MRRPDSDNMKIKGRAAVPDPDEIKEQFWQELESAEAREKPMHDINAIFERSKAMNYKEVARNVTRRHEVRHEQPEGFRFFWKPLGLTLGAGMPGLLFVVLAISLPRVLEAAGMELSRAGGGMGLARLGIAFLGFILLMLASPNYKPNDWTQAKQRELERERQRYHEKKFGPKG